MLLLCCFSFAQLSAYFIFFMCVAALFFFFASLVLLFASLLLVCCFSLAFLLFCLFRFDVASLVCSASFPSFVFLCFFLFLLLKFIHVVNNDTSMHAVHSCTVAFRSLS